MSEECIFCKMIEGQVDSEKVYEDENNVAILDINPSSPGHTLVFPKKHAVHLSGLDDIELSDLFFAVDEVIAILEDSLEPDGFNVGWNHGQIAGQAVPHIHVHVIPRYEGDKGAPIQAIVQNESEIDVKAISQKINSKSASVTANEVPKSEPQVQEVKQETTENEEGKKSDKEGMEKNKNDKEEKDTEDEDLKEARKKWENMKIPRY